MENVINCESEKSYTFMGILLFNEIVFTFEENYIFTFTVKTTIFLQNKMLLL